MCDLTIIKQNGIRYIDSREIAIWLEKPHGNIMRYIEGYIKSMQRINKSKFGVLDYFFESSYEDTKGVTRPCYLISEQGCGLIANRLRGVKSVLFTVAYTSKFKESKGDECSESEALSVLPVYSAKQVAAILGIYSMYGNPHYQAVGYILYYLIRISKEHKKHEEISKIFYGLYFNKKMRYSKHDINALKDWVKKNNYPCEIEGCGKTYSVIYRNRLV